jgi:hypothetical protein
MLLVQVASGVGELCSLPMAALPLAPVAGTLATMDEWCLPSGVTAPALPQALPRLAAVGCQNSIRICRTRTLGRHGA